MGGKTPFMSAAGYKDERINLPHVTLEMNITQNAVGGGGIYMSKAETREEVHSCKTKKQLWQQVLVIPYQEVSFGNTEVFPL